MNEKAIKLYLENYNNKGLCEGLEKQVKTINKEFKKSGITKIIKYLPWAIAERIFRLQGGKIEVVDWRYSVDFEGKDYNPETGEIEEGKKSALFVHLKGTWQDEELDEYYPIFDNQTSKIIKTPDAQQLNASRQRGSVRLIARLSGIGLWIFEQQEEEDEEKSNEVIIPIKKEEEPKKVVAKQQKKAKSQEKDEAMADILGVDFVEDEPKEESVVDVILGNVIKPTKHEIPKKQEPQIEQAKVEIDYPKETEQHADALLQVKKYVKTHKDQILEFRNTKGKELLSDLTYFELKELLGIIEA